MLPATSLERFVDLHTTIRYGWRRHTIEHMQSTLRCKSLSSPCQSRSSICEKDLLTIMPELLGGRGLPMTTRLHRLPVTD